MTVKFFTYESALPSAQGKYAAKTLIDHAIGIDEMVERIAQAKTALGKGDIRGVIETMCELIELEVTAGNRVQLGGICRIRPMIRGSFDGPTGGFDPEVNSVEVCITPGARLSKAVHNNAEVEKIGKPAVIPTLKTFTDIASGAVNTAINCSSLGQLDGLSLFYDEEQADEGLFLFDNMDPTPVKVTVIQKATEKQMVFDVPNVVSASAETGYFVLRRRNHPDGPLVEGQSETMDLTPASQRLAAVAAGAE